MTRHEMIAALDQEIQRLEAARSLLRQSRDLPAKPENRTKFSRLLPKRGSLIAGKKAAKRSGKPGAGTEDGGYGLQRME
jgi:hypothetical protein